MASTGDLAGTTVLVTGGNSGIGLEAARALARRGADVVISARDVDKGRRAVEDITRDAPTASVAVAELDLADLASVHAAAKRVADEHPSLDVLVNNAGVMATPYRQTADGFELQFGTNHLGHFALTGLLLPTLLAAPAPRVVTISSGAHKVGRIDFDNLDASRSYRPWVAYAQSKLANLLFMFELQRRADAAGVGLLSVGAHPGYAATNLQSAGPRMMGSRARLALHWLGNRVLAQSAAAGAEPTVHAATAPGLAGGDYIGPAGFNEMRGRPTKVKATSAAQDPDTAGRLWDVSESLTGVRYEALQR